MRKIKIASQEKAEISPTLVSSNNRRRIKEKVNDDEMNTRDSGCYDKRDDTSEHTNDLMNGRSKPLSTMKNQSWSRLTKKVYLVRSHPEVATKIHFQQASKSFQKCIEANRIKVGRKPKAVERRGRKPKWWWWWLVRSKPRQPPPLPWVLRQEPLYSPVVRQRTPWQVPWQHRHSVAPKWRQRSSWRREWRERRSRQEPQHEVARLHPYLPRTHLPRPRE